MGFNSAFFAALAFDRDLGATRGIDAVLKQHNLDALVLTAEGFTTVPAGMRIILCSGHDNLTVVDSQRSQDIL